VSTVVPDRKPANSAQSRHVAPHELVRQRREAKGITQAEAAALAKISREEWNGIENGRRGIGPRNALRLARVLGGTAEEYLTRPTQPDIAELREMIAALERRVDALERRLRP